jgi:hypothetical protein
MPDMRHIKTGDKVKRQFGPTPGPIMVLHVTEVDDELIYCGPKETGWSFDRATGAEVDHGLGWGPMYGMTGTFLIGLVDEEPSAGGSQEVAE